MAVLSPFHDQILDTSALILHSLLDLNISSRASTIDTGAVLTFYKKEKKVIAW